MRLVLLGNRTMSKFFAPFVVALLTCFPLSVAVADVFKFVDATGNVYYTDKPKHSGYKRILRSPPAAMAVSYVTNNAGLTRLVGKAGGGSRPSGRHLSANSLLKQQELSPLIDAAASKYSLDPALLHAVIRAESGYNPGAVSHKGAAGLMQLMPATASRYGVRDRFDPQENIEGGARYLSDLLEMFPSDVKLAVAAYNSGENTVKKFGNQVPPITETQNYVDRVLGYYYR